MVNRLALPPLYVILDAALLPSDPVEFVKRLMGAGARLFQYRNKAAPAREVLQAAHALNVTVLQEGGSFLVNDRPDIARLVGANGVHVGQDDLDVAAARAIVDSAAYADAVNPPYYDSMIAKLIVKGRDRTEAIGRMKRALEMFVIEGIKTSIPLHRRILADADFAAGKFDTHFVERFLSNGKH